MNVGRNDKFVVIIFLAKCLPKISHTWAPLRCYSFVTNVFFVLF
jgi:hypothetical protein